MMRPEPKTILIFQTPTTPAHPPMAIFVWGYQVPLSDGWVEQLSRLLGCRVSNYGVSGYGVDQAFIRFRRNVNDVASIVLLGVYSQDVMRDVNQYRAFIGFPIDAHAVKGRFILDKANELKWIPRPQLDLQRFIKLNFGIGGDCPTRGPAPGQPRWPGH